MWAYSSNVIHSMFHHLKKNKRKPKQYWIKNIQMYIHMYKVVWLMIFTMLMYKVYDILIISMYVCTYECMTNRYVLAKHF